MELSAAPLTCYIHRPFLFGNEIAANNVVVVVIVVVVFVVAAAVV